MEITCISRNVPDITTLQILNPSGVAIHASLGIFTVPNVTQSYAGTYTCVITSNLDNSTMNATSVVVVECKLSPCNVCTTIMDFCFNSELQDREIIYKYIRFRQNTFYNLVKFRMQEICRIRHDFLYFVIVCIKYSSISSATCYTAC